MTAQKPTRARRRDYNRSHLPAMVPLGVVAAALVLAAVVAPTAAPARGQPAPGDREAAMERQREQARRQRQQNREQQFKSYQSMVANMPRMDARTLDDVMTFKMDSKHLSCTSPLIDPDNPRNGQYRVEVGPFKDRGPTYVQVMLSFNGAMFGGVGVRFGAAARPPQPQRTFNLISYDTPTGVPTEALSTLNLQAAPGWLQIVRNTQVGDGNRSVQVIDSHDPDNHNGFVQFTVSEYGTGAEAKPPEAKPPSAPRNFTFRAADFYGLLHEHPREAEEFIRPLLRDLGQEAVFAPDVLVAWQVFAKANAGTWKADEQLTARIKGLLPAMASSDYRVRERAVADLEGMGRAGAAALLHLDRDGLSAQQNLVIDRALAPYAQLTPREAEQLGKDRAFLLDCLYSPDRTIRAAALARVRAVTEQDVQFDLNAAAADRAAAVTGLRKQLLAGDGPPSTQPRMYTSGPATRPATAPAAAK